MRAQNIGLKVAALALFGVVTLMGALYLFKSAGGNSPFGDPYQVRVLVPDAFQLVQNGDVKRAGVTVGKVASITNRGGTGLVTLNVDDEHAPVYRDATVQVRTKSLLGENYLELEPGTPRRGAVGSGGTLPLERARDAISLDVILDSLGPRTRRALRSDLRSLGRGVEDRGTEVNRLFASLPPAVSTGGRVVAALARQRRQLAGLIDYTGTVTAAVGRRERQVRRLVLGAKTTAETVSKRDAALRQTFEQLPSTLRQARSSLQTLSGFSSRALPVVHGTRAAVRDLTPVVRRLGPTARDARALVGDLPAFMRVADPLARRLKEFSADARPSVEPLDLALRELNPALQYIAPYHRELAAVLANMGSAFNHDKYGHFGHVFPLVSPASAAVWSPQMREALDALSKAGFIGKFVQADTNAYPKPGTSPNPQPFDGKYPIVKAADK
jgi:phospholipid/cholesterol/gamma-HCH transport system substrate-binding protein